MLASKLLEIIIVEDDDIQAKVLKDQLADSNPMASIEVFKNGADLFATLTQGMQKNHFYFIILDYFLQTTDNSEVLNGYEVVQKLHILYPEIKVVLHSAYESDEGTNFINIKEDYSNVIEFVKKSEHAYLSLQNLLRFNFMEWQLCNKRQRLKIAFIVFVSVLALSALHFFTSFMSV